MKMKHRQAIAWSLTTVAVTVILTGIMVTRLDRLANSVMWIADVIIFFVVFPSATVSLYFFIDSAYHRWLRRKLRRRPKPIPISLGRKKIERERRRKSG